MHFEILGDIEAVETIAAGTGISEIARLRKLYGRARWRKRKGFALVRLRNGRVVSAEMKLVRLASENSRSNVSCEKSHG
jgi:hypothetical protein